MLVPSVILFLSVVLSEQEIFAKTCKDCKLLDTCPGALYLAVNKKNPLTEKLIIDSICSQERVNGIPKVCCSEFPSAPEEIENHPNIRLLPKDCGAIEGSQIVGGEETKLYEFPWMVLISYNTRIGLQFLCGGSLITPLYVLTAAHCVKEKNIAGVRLGDYDLEENVDCEKNTFICESNHKDVGVAETIIYPTYSGPPIVRNDIALLRLKTPADITLRNIDLVCLPITRGLRERTLERERAVVTGWGLTENYTTATVLRKVDIPISTRERCKHYYQSYSNEDLTKTILCAGELGKDSCKGDSGGPLMLEGKYVNGASRFIQHGIVSHGPSQCGSSFPGVYTDVSWYMKWILDTIRP
ncbi:CLIP domain-containing serine protease HP8-like [Battus philenor]|uniref:CLIP domain-containing serine protease HP8-like n=1 Tax=Battus philenor TaxID=42288 RepID=UPI0035CFCADD